MPQLIDGSQADRKPGDAGGCRRDDSAEIVNASACKFPLIALFATYCGMRETTAERPPGLPHGHCRGPPAQSTHAGQRIHRMPLDQLTAPSSIITLEPCLVLAISLAFD